MGILLAKGGDLHMPWKDVEILLAEVAARICHNTRMGQGELTVSFD